MIFCLDNGEISIDEETMTLPPIYVITGITSLVFIALLFQRSRPEEKEEEFTDTQAPKHSPNRSQPALKKRRVQQNIPRVISIYLVPKSPINGASLLQFFMTHKLQYSDQEIFQSQDGDAVQYSIATLSPPGTFDLDSLPEQHITGLSFFIQTDTSSEKLLQYYDNMCGVLFDAKERFEATIRDNNQSEINLHHLKAWRDSMHENEMA